MDFFLNKIDPQLVKAIKEVTSTNVIHKKDDVPIEKEDKSKDDSRGKERRNRKRAIQRVKALNDLANENNLEMFFVLDDGEDHLWIKVFDKKSKKCLKTFDEDEVEEMIKKLQVMLGIIVDTKI